MIVATTDVSSDNAPSATTEGSSTARYRPLALGHKPGLSRPSKRMDAPSRCVHTARMGTKGTGQQIGRGPWKTRRRARRGTKQGSCPPLPSRRTEEIPRTTHSHRDQQAANATFAARIGYRSRNVLSPRDMGVDVFRWRRLDMSTKMPTAKARPAQRHEIDGFDRQATKRETAASKRDRNVDHKRSARFSNRAGTAAP